MRPADLVKSSRFLASSVHDRAMYARQLCEALVSMHKRGIVMVDLKPANVMLAVDKATSLSTVVFIDGDSWRRVGETIGADAGGGVIETSAFTPMYAAPELLVASSNGTLARLAATFEMDMMSLGLMLAMLLSPACTPPFASDEAAMAAAVSHTPPPPAALGCGGSAFAAELVVALTAVDPAVRGRVSLAALLEKNKFLNAGLKSATAHEAMKIGYARAVCVCAACTAGVSVFWWVRGGCTRAAAGVMSATSRPCAFSFACMRDRGLGCPRCVCAFSCDTSNACGVQR